MKEYDPWNFWKGKEEHKQDTETEISEEDKKIFFAYISLLKDRISSYDDILARIMVQKTEKRIIKTQWICKYLLELRGAEETWWLITDMTEAEELEQVNAMLKGETTQKMKTLELIDKISEVLKIKDFKKWILQYEGSGKLPTKSKQIKECPAEIDRVNYIKFFINEN